MTKPLVLSPCIGQCCLDPEDICVGCYRHVDEICAWTLSNDDEKKAIISRCEERKAQRERDVPS